jgi:E1A-binding protein p400
VDDETTIEAEEQLGRDMSYADEIALLQKENEMSIEELRAMYANMERDSSDHETSDEEEQVKQPVIDDTGTVAASNSLSLLDEDDHEEINEFHPDDEVDDETTIEAEEQLGRDMSYADEIALLQKENEMSIEELRAMYADMEQHDNSETDTMEVDSVDDDATVTAGNILAEKSSLAILNATIDDVDDENEEDFTIQDMNMELDDETTIDAEEKLGRDMTYEQEISLLEQENEMSVEELRKLYGLDASEDGSEAATSADDTLKRKRDESVDESDDDAHEDKKCKLVKDEGLTALKSLAATDARARETSKFMFIACCSLLLHRANNI